MVTVAVGTRQVGDALAGVAETKSADRGPLAASPRGANFWPIVAVVAVLIVVTAFVTLVFWPGQLDPDTADELHGAASGRYTDWHTPILSWMWRAPYLMGLRSPGWVLASCVFTMLLGFYLVLRVRFARSTSTGVAVVCLAWPPVLSWAVHVGRDAWFAACLLASFGFLARLLRMGKVQKPFNLIGLSVSAFICAAAWQIALVALIPAFFVTAASLLPRRTRRRGILAFVAAIAACLALFGTQLVVERLTGTTSLHPEQATYVYDLTRISVDDGRVLFPKEVLVEHRHGDPLSYLNALPIGAYDQIVFGPRAVVVSPVEGNRLSALRNAWATAILHHPWSYLSERADLALAQFAITEPSFWTFQAPPSYGYVPLAASLQNAGMDYLSAFSTGGNLHGDLLYTVWVYELIAAVSVPILVRRRRPGDLAAAALGAGCVLFSVAMVFTTPTLVYRYGFPIVVMGSVLAPVLIPARAGGRRPWSAAGSPTPNR